MLKLIYPLLFVSSAFLNNALAQEARSFTSLSDISESKKHEIDQAIPVLMKQYGVNSVGLGLIKNTELVYSGYFGNQREGVPANKTTQFDVASITKTMTAETVLRLVAADKLTLDEPMANYWVDPDLRNDSKHFKLTPRMALNHSTGFPNWRYFSVDGSLMFESEPGTSYSYSGEGFDYLARMVELKLQKPFDALVNEYVIQALGLKNTYFHVAKSNFSNLNEALTDEGKHLGHYCFPWGGCREEGSWSAADDLRITVEDFAVYLKAVMNAGGYNAALVADRNTVQTDMTTHPDSVSIVCARLARNKCPKEQGYGLGWQVADYGHTKLISHGGSDWSELAEAYFYTESKDGVIIFLNGLNQNSLAMMPHVIKLLDPESPKIPHYEMWYEKESGGR
ncbi:serine hydrolase domain-containing protein [Ningiella sp. W23]|uniref:serine hydrolase domain-containing protein n=1 Tax=Ningiella sp. W23 TaxID=3023715 RepID=UPI0037569F4D